MADTQRLSGKKGIVTGAGKGIGRDLALRLVELGASVFAIARTESDLESLQSEARVIAESQGREDVDSALTFKVCDVADNAALRIAIEDAGDTDFLVNNAGVALLQPLLETDPDKFDTTMAINVRSALVATQVFAKRLISRKASGAIVNVSSQASMIALKDHASYCTSKAAMDHLTKCSALELGEHGIRVNSVNPTVVLTEMGKRGWSDPVKAAPMLSSIPLGRFAEPREVSNVIAFLISEEASMLTGVLVPVDGGRVIQ